MKLKTDRQFDYLTFIGRMEPPHIGHIEVAISALDIAEHLIILIGSSNQPRKFKNPWTFEERKEMIIRSLGHVMPSLLNRISILPIRDKKYNDPKWAQGVQQAVGEAVNSTWYNHERKPEIGIIGHSKDETSYYLKMFPQWGNPIEHPLNENISATEIRELYFEGKNLKFLEALLPVGTYEYLKLKRESAAYEYVKSEYEYIKGNRKKWDNSPHPVNFVTVDAVVIQSGHILMVKRAAAPGEGLWALPGGYLEVDETIIQGTLRELDEETKLKVPDRVLVGSIASQHVFDAPDRSEVGRIITHATHFELEPGPLPKIRGGLDVDGGTKKAKWIPLNELDESKIFDDHYHIIDFFIGLDD